MSAAFDPLAKLAAFDPAPLFVISLVPYLAFLWWASRVRAFPRLSLLGFQLTLLFVAVTIVAAVIAQVRFGRQLADVDPLHGGAEAFLTLSNALVAAGFAKARLAAAGAQQMNKSYAKGASATAER